MSVVMFDANELGTVLACALAAVTTEGHLKPADHTRLGLGIAKSLAEVSKLNRKTYATRYGEIPPASVKVEEIVQAAQQVDPFESPEACSSSASNFRASGASSLAYNTDLRGHPKVEAQLAGLHDAITSFARQQSAKVTQAKYAAEQGLRIAQVESGRYPWVEVRTSGDGKAYIRSKDKDTFTQDLGKALKEATGRTWSVSRSRGTASSWVNVDAPPARRTCEWDGVTPAPKGQGYSCQNDREVLGKAVHAPGGVAHPQGESIPPDPGCRERVYDLVKGRSDPAVCKPNWD